MESFKMSIKEDEDPPSAHLDMSPIKKERIKKAEKERLRCTLRSTLPVLTKQEIRKWRLPYYQATLADLEEAGFVNTAEFVKELIEWQTQNRRIFGPGTVIWIRPQLKDSKSNLDLLVKALINAETAHNAQNFAVEWDEMLRLAAHYAFGSDDWWWLGEQLLYQCVSMQYPGDFNRQKAIAYFIIGKYLVENGKKIESGRYYLDMAREISRGKSWTCTKIFNTKQDIVFIESCRLLYKTLLEEATALMKIDPEKAAEICNVARKRASEACEHAAEAQALLIRGRCELFLNKTAEAIATITKALNRTQRRKNIKGVCEAKVAIALANLQHGKHQACIEHLKDLKALAEEYDMQFYVAQAYRFMGEYYLSLDKPYEATPYIMLAFYLFHQVKDMRRREKVRTWAAISAGEELFPAFITLIQNCDNSETGTEGLMKLIKWIDEKEYFWTQQTKFSFSYSSLQQSIIDEKHG